MMLPIPAAPLPPDEIAELLRPLVFEHSALCGHPGFMAYVSGSGTVPGAPPTCSPPASTRTSAAGCCRPAATELELHLMRWMAERFGLPTGLRRADDERRRGVELDGAEGGPRRARAGRRAPRRHRRAGSRLYTSQEAHATIAEAADMLGLGERAVRKIPTDEGFRMRVDDAGARDRGRHRGGPAAVRRRRHAPAPPPPGAIDPLAGRSPTSASSTTSGATSMPPTAARRCSRPRCGRCCAASSGPTRSHSIPTNGCTRRSPAPASGARRPAGSGRLRIDAAYVCEDAEMLARGVNIGELGRNGRARSSRSRCGCRWPPTALRRTPAGSPTTSSSPGTSTIAAEHHELESMAR